MEERNTAYELDAMSRKLEDYLLGDDLYKTITVTAPSGDRLIKMTIGGMLERIDELAEQDETHPAIQRANEALERARSVQTNRYYGMLGREAKSYTDSWNWFLQNCWEGEGRCRADYPLEVPLRLRVERLLEEGGDRPELVDTRNRIRSLDRQLREIWEEQDEPVVQNGSRYPRERYWWLYGRPNPQKD